MLKMPTIRFFLRLLFSLSVLGSLLLSACQVNGSIPRNLNASATYEVLDQFPHDPTAYTQGLLIHNGLFYESTGTYGNSSLRVVEPKTGKVLQDQPLEDRYFGEGLALLNNKLYQLTWRENTGFVYDLNTLELINTWQYDTEGWGLTTDGTNLIMSDGSADLRWIDPVTFEVLRVLEVTQDGIPATRLNELEWIEGEIYTNVYTTETILRIDPETGEVLTVLDMSGLTPDVNKADPNEVLNGIVYDPATKRLFVTGKLWDVLYEIRLIDSPVNLATKQP
ncbi:MAG: glutaminyl-peptide cyclotransferase [Anaerolineaceae bacterium]